MRAQSGNTLNVINPEKITRGIYQKTGEFGFNISNTEEQSNLNTLTESQVRTIPHNTKAGN